MSRAIHWSLSLSILLLSSVASAQGAGPVHDPQSPTNNTQVVSDNQSISHADEQSSDTEKTGRSGYGRGYEARVRDQQIHPSRPERINRPERPERPERPSRMGR